MKCNWIKNIFGRRIKNKINNLKIETKVEVSGVEVCDDGGFKGSIGGANVDLTREPAVMTEKLAQQEASYARTISAIEGIDSYEDRESMKLSLAKNLVDQQKVLNQDDKPPMISQHTYINSFHPKGDSLYQFLSKLDFKDLFLPNNLCDGGILLWPMNIQDDITYIHIAQYNIARLFINHGWRLKVIIGDCGHNATNGNYDIKNEFTKSLNRFFTSNNLENNQYEIIPLSDYFMRDTNSSKIDIEHKDLLRQFHIICDSVLWKDYKNEILKEYDDAAKAKIENRKLLNNIQPLLIWSVVAAINQNCVSSSQGKVVVLAGQDEYKQWERIVDTSRRNNLGAIFIQELKTTDGNTMDQTEIKIRSQSALKEKISTNINLAKWLFLHFIELPSYGKQKEPFSFCELQRSQCESQNGNCMKCLFEDGNYNKHLNKDKYVEYMYPLINSAN